MKILYAIQGTGNGHISRAKDIIPILQKKGDVDILISGTQVDISLPYFIKYRMHGISFIFGKNGGVDLVQTYKKSNLRRFFKEFKSIPIKDYDLVISDFEPVSAWACRTNHKICIGLSHQNAVSNKKSPKPTEKDLIGKAILKNYAPVDYAYGFHFQVYDHNIFTPVIRNEIRHSIPEKKDHYTVYLPAYSDKKLIKFFSEIRSIKWEVFSKHSDKSYVEKNVSILPIKNDTFIKSLVTCSGIVCGAGFETPAEALFLQKKLMVIPMKGQYEQQCNAASLLTMNVPVIKKLKLKNLVKVKSWVEKQGPPIMVDYPDITESVIDLIIEKQFFNTTPIIPHLGLKPYSIKKLKKLTLNKILSKSV